jgi:hypothetical protein
MVKETKYDHHPVRIVKGLALGIEQEYGGIIQLDLQSTAIATVTSSNSTGWQHVDLGAYAPANARAAILDVAARDAAGAATDAYLEIGYPGIILSTKTQIVYCGDVNDRWQSRIVYAVLNDDDKINVKVTASGAVFDYTMKLIGWVLDPYVAKVTPPSEELKATLVVNQ